ncbi:SDR family NAD(P)-dependent oxidoreductase [Sulfitobacter sp. D35]|uniref:SDR family NAD(P)-dependent oxidoreductase n=1 Tax=Sulfitobacter sp. D35 TaxID=3083252 RepID=UPI00296EFA8A|nr:SDR family NAD(P)-dependent oxidoreductase [Sulfitobacter sp. D35]MDW4498278.1 SDR family NAD(P)-dependent oxidoreductase [Sulfitobacter sp. D35]
MTRNVAVIVGTGSGLSASLARQLAARDMQLVLAARDTGKLKDLAGETGAETVAMDASDPAQMAALFSDLPGRLSIAIYNPSARQRAPLVELDPESVRTAIEVTAFGAFLMGQQAARLMLENEGDVKGTILFTGASAGVKGFAKSAPFAMGKFAQRGLAQSMARELHPQGIHVAWVNIDGAIGDAQPTAADGDRRLDPDAIATAYMALIDQHRSTWSNELSLRPWVESF